MDAWSRYLFESHSQRELSDWARRLAYFRFRRAVGGHAGDGDELVLWLRHAGGEDAQLLAQQLGARALVTGRHELHDVAVFMVASEQRISLCIAGAAGDLWEVTELDVSRAAVLETHLHAVADRVIEPAREDKHCISPLAYPHFWAS